MEDYKSKSNQSFFLMSFFAALWKISLYLAYFFANSQILSLIFTRLANSFPIIVLLFLSNFFYIFPVRTLILPKILRILFAILLIVTFIISAFTPLVQTSITIQNGEILSETLGPFFKFFTYEILIICFFLGLYVYKKSKTLYGIEKIKIKIILITFILIAALSTLTNLILPQFGIKSLVNESVLFIYIFIIPTLYAIHKHRFFHLSYVALNFLRIIIFILSFILLGLFLLKISESLFPNLNSLINIFIISGLSLIIFQKIEKYFPKFQNKNLRELTRIIDKLKTKIYYCKTMKKITTHLENSFLKSLNIKNVKLCVVKSQNDHLDLPIYPPNDFTKILSIFRNKIIILPEIKYLKLQKNQKEILIKNLQNLKAIICLSLFAENKLIGFLILGNKSNNQLYTKEEIKEIQRIQGDLEICLMNLLLKLNLQEENNLMKQIINQKTENLKKQFQDIKNLLENQSDFLAITAHEFRTPLSIAMFQLEDTLYRYKHTPAVLKDMEIMNDSLNNLKELTQKLFDIQQYDLNKVKLYKQKVNINEFLKKIHNSFKKVMKENNINFYFKNNLSREIQLNIDTSQIQQVLNNLITNAMKFTNKQKGEIVMKLNEDNKNLFISITDNGGKIPNKQKKLIFKKFQTSRDSTKAGIGLGLYICKKIIDLHKAKIWVEDTTRDETMFIIKFKKSSKYHDL